MSINEQYSKVAWKCKKIFIFKKLLFEKKLGFLNSTKYFRNFTHYLKIGYKYYIE